VGTGCRGEYVKLKRGSNRRQLQNEELHNLCSLLKSRERNTHKILIIKLERRRPLRRASLRWEANIKMYLKEIGFEDMGLKYVSLKDILKK
jgi:hypothetical protein